MPKRIVKRYQRSLLGAHVPGEYSAEMVQIVVAWRAGNMRIEEVAELQLAYPTVTEGVRMAAQKIVCGPRFAPLSQLRATLLS